MRLKSADGLKANRIYFLVTGCCISIDRPLRRNTATALILLSKKKTKPRKINYKSFVCTIKPKECKYPFYFNNNKVESFGFVVSLGTVSLII